MCVSYAIFPVEVIWITLFCLTSWSDLLYQYGTLVKINDCAAIYWKFVEHKSQHWFTLQKLAKRNLGRNPWVKGQTGGHLSHTEHQEALRQFFCQTTMTWDDTIHWKNTIKQEMSWNIYLSVSKLSTGNPSRKRQTKYNLKYLDNDIHVVTLTMTLYYYDYPKPQSALSVVLFIS